MCVCLDFELSYFSVNVCMCFMQWQNNHKNRGKNYPGTDVIL